MQNQMSNEILCDADDFMEDSNGLHILYRIKAKNPAFKINLFTIPGLCSLEFINEIKKIDWIDMLPHGLMHPTPRECENWTYEDTIQYLDAIEPLGLTKCFKCYDDKTEVLTDNGWKLFKNLGKEDKVMSVNKDSLIGRYVTPSDYFSAYYSGKMIGFGNSRGLNLVVTPDHRMLVRDRYSKELKTVEAKDTNNNCNIIRKFNWQSAGGSSVFVLPEFTNYWGKLYPSVQIKMNDWLELLGMYLTEGTLHGKSAIRIYQSNDKDRVRTLMQRLPFKYTEIGNTFTLKSPQITNYMIDKGLNHSSTKYIPKEFKLLPKEKLKILLDVMIWGDGTARKEYPSRRYYSVSKKLSDDVQELFLKTGSLANVRMRKVKGKNVAIGDNPIYKANYNQWIVEEVVGRAESCIRTTGKYNNKREIDYDGMIYCVTVDTGMVVVRRNGKPCVCGNSPGWQISNGTYDALKQRGYWVADQHYNDHRRPKDLVCIFPDKHYHIPEVCGNGIKEKFDELVSLRGEFLFIKDLMYNSIKK